MIAELELGLSEDAKRYMALIEESRQHIFDLLRIPSVHYRVREYTRPSGYWVYCSNEMYDWYNAIKTAVEYERRTGIATWVEVLWL